jgi:ApbE superfamily uncharacterized protein (UPF0280 family)
MEKKLPSLFKKDLIYKETVGRMISDKKTALSSAVSSIKKHRRYLEKYISRNPSFLHSFQPLRIGEGPLIVKKMAEASRKAGVGPMAAVAGVLADLAVEAMIVEGARVAVVENGGEASVNSIIPIDIALAAGNNVLSRQIGFRLEESPVGVATSSGKFSHAFSFGEADAVTVFAENAGIADAAATAVGNVVKGNDESAAVRKGIEKGLLIKGVKGIFIIYGEKTGQGGDIPKLIKIREQETA